MLYEDFQDEVLELLRKVANGMQDGTAEDVLLDAFNDDMTQNYVITHFKVGCNELLARYGANSMIDSNSRVDEDTTTGVCTMAY